MKKMTGHNPFEAVKLTHVTQGLYEGQTVTVQGMVHSIHNMGGIAFLILRGPKGILQCVLDQSISPPGLTGECAVTVTGVPRKEPRAPGGVELAAESLKLLSQPAAPMPVPISKRNLELNLDTELSLRPLTLRSLRQRSVFHIQEGLCRAFRETLHSLDFTEVHTPKIVHAGAEGGSNIFRLDYFGRKAFLTQSPQFYKQMMVGAYERVFEVAPVFRAEKHSTPRHLNEYTSMDLEMGFLHSFEDLMDVETLFLQRAMSLLEEEYAADIAALGLQLPNTSYIPCLRFDQAKRLAAEKYGRPIRDPYDLEPEEEVNIGRYAQEELDSDFVFITHYPSKKRPFYAMDDPDDSRFTLSFDLLFRGMEVTTGGQRIHDYQQQVDKMLARGMHPEEFKSYLMIHRSGMPPHGGLGIGLERLTAKLCGLDNVRHACLFPRDLNRLDP